MHPAGRHAPFDRAALPRLLDDRGAGLLRAGSDGVGLLGPTSGLLAPLATLTRGGARLEPPGVPAVNPTSSQGSGLFDALIMAATSRPAAAQQGLDGATLLSPGSFAGFPINAVRPISALATAEPFASTRLQSAAATTIFAQQQPQQAQLLTSPLLVGGGVGGAAAAAGVGATSPTAGGAGRMRPPPQRDRSRLWSALSTGEIDSLQNALDAYVKGGEDEIVSKPFNGDSDTALPGAAAAAAGGGSPSDLPTRARRRKPPRGNSSFLLRAVDSGGMGFSGLGSLGNLGFSLGFKENSDDNEASVGGNQPAESGGGEAQGGDGGDTAETTNLAAKDDREGGVA